MYLSQRFRMLFAILIWQMGHNGSVRSEITLDGTLGPGGALPGPDYQIPADVGQQSGPNLFHSFGFFNVNTGESATFNGPAAIDNVICRITGGQSTTIDGALRSKIPSADLYLINPAGIMFGPHATLDVDGSFHGSTADYVRLGEEGRFDASKPQNSVLASAAPSAFGFLGNNPVATISLQSSTLEMSAGENISLVGGDIEMTGARLSAPAGRINIASVAAEGEVVPAQTDLNVEAFEQLGTVTHSQGGIVDVSGVGGGRVFIRAGNFQLKDSIIAANTRGNVNGGVVDVDVTGELLISGGSLRSTTETEVRGTDITLAANSLEMRDGARVEAFSLGPGRGGNLEVEAQTMVLEGFGTALLAIAQGTDPGSGDAGDITVKADRLEMRPVTQIAAVTAGPGKSGNLEVEAETIILEGEGGNFSTGFTVSTFGANPGSGDAGNLKVNTDRLEMRAGAQISAGTSGPGKGGKLDVQAETMALEGIGTALLTNTQGIDSDSGDGGDITVEADRLEMRDGAQISVSTFGTGNGGDLTVEAETVVLEGLAVLLNNAQGKGPNNGDGGNISVKTGYLEMRDRAQISAATISTGTGGDVKVEADTILMEGGDNFSSTALNVSTFGTDSDSGDAGILTVKTDHLEVRDGAKIAAITFGPGKGGKLEVEAVTILLEGVRKGLVTGLIASAVGKASDSGDGGEITVKADHLEMRNEALISADTLGSGMGGHLKVEADTIFLKGGVPGSSTSIGVSTFGKEPDSGAGGNLIINAGRLEMHDGAQIGAITNGPGRGGKLEVKADAIFLDGRGADFRTGIFTNSEGENPGSGDAGDIKVKANSLQMSNDAIIAAITFGPGKGGNMEVNTVNIDLRAGSNISVESTGTGKAGDILIQAIDTFHSEDSSVTAEANQAAGGDIEVSAKSLQLIHSPITASVTQGEGGGGNVTLNAKSIAALQDSDITARADKGHGGNITINAEVFLKSDNVDLNASSNVIGNEGVVAINTPDLDVSGQLANLPTAYLDISPLLGERCKARERGKVSSFVVLGRGGLPLEPGELLSATSLDALRDRDFSRAQQETKTIMEQGMESRITTDRLSARLLRNCR